MSDITKKKILDNVIAVDDPDLNMLKIREQEVLEEMKAHQKIALDAIIAAEASLTKIREEIELIISKQINSSRCNNCGNPVAPRPEVVKNMKMFNANGNEEDKYNTGSEATKEAALTISNKTGNVTSTPSVVPSGWGGYSMLGPGAANYTRQRQQQQSDQYEDSTAKWPKTSRCQRRVSRH